MTVKVAPSAYNDIVIFYENAMKAHPNTFGPDDAIDAIENTYQSIIDKVNSSMMSGKEPLLSSLNDGNTIELSTKKKGKAFWYFTLYLDNDSAVIENAWHYSNASNRAYRRGDVNPSAPLSADNRQRQRNKNLKETYESMGFSIPNYALRKIIKESINDILRQFI